MICRKRKNTHNVPTNQQLGPPDFILHLCCQGCGLQSGHFPAGYRFIPHDSPQSACPSVLGVPPTQQDIWSGVWFHIIWITFKTPHTTGQSDKITLRTKQSRCSPGLLYCKARIGPKIALIILTSIYKTLSPILKNGNSVGLCDSYLFLKSMRELP